MYNTEIPKKKTSTSIHLKKKKSHNSLQNWKKAKAILSCFYDPAHAVNSAGTNKKRLWL